MSNVIDRFKENCPSVQLRSNLVILVRVLGVETLLRSAVGGNYWLSVSVDDGPFLSGCKNPKDERALLNDAFIMELPSSTDVDIIWLHIVLCKPQRHTPLSSGSFIKRVASHLILSTKPSREEFDTIGKIDIPLKLLLGLPDGLKGTFTIENRLRERVANITMHVTFPSDSVHTMQSQGKHAESSTVKFDHLMYYDSARNIWIPVCIWMNENELKVESMVSGLLEVIIRYADIELVEFSSRYHMNMTTLIVKHVCTSDASGKIGGFELIGLDDTSLQSLSNKLGRRILRFR